MNLTDCQQRLAIARASERFHRGRMNCRQFWCLCAQASFGFSRLYLLVGCSSNPATAPTPAQISEATGSELLTLIVGAAMLMTGPYALLVVREFPNFSLHTKLMMAFLIIALGSLSLLVFLYDQASRVVLTEAANQSLFEEQV